MILGERWESNEALCAKQCELEPILFGERTATSGMRLPLDGNPGGAPELLIPDPQTQVELKGVYGVNPEP